MEKSVVTSKGQTVIPKAVRRALGIKEGTVLAWSVLDRAVTVVPVSADPVRALRGILKGVEGMSAQHFLQDRREDLELEDAKWRRLGYAP
ncbi:MAG: AbrB/MazE/SpoVT family DNA-binding domain-containing protein [Chloroflexi bacterium]|nr:AbrB/MazE/SpoVT family DNA-binding domain-containing protein [Chloroflexota bacterium]